MRDSTKKRPKSKSKHGSVKKNSTMRHNKHNIEQISSAIKNISFEKARSDFKALQDLDFSKTSLQIQQTKKIGNSVMDYYFFKYRLHTKTKRGISYYDWIKTRWQQNESEYRMYKFNLAQGKNQEQARYGVFRLYYGSTQGFKPTIAKWLYFTYAPKVAALDFSAGWGGRCLAAMSLGIPYIGIDTNTSLRPVYNKMVRELRDLTNPNSTNININITMIFKDAATVDYSKYSYDMVFTSPPYFKKFVPAEEYPHMPKYTSRDDFNDRFLFPTIQNTFTHLKRGGTYAINIPEDTYHDIQQAKLLPSKLTAKHRLFIQPRFAKGNPVNPDKQYKEYIYVWKKP